MDEELSVEEKINILFKKLYYKSCTNINIPYYQENYNSYSKIIPDKQILSNKIPDIAPIELQTATTDDDGNILEGSTIGKTSNDGIIKRYKKLELNYVSGSAIGNNPLYYTGISFYSEKLIDSIIFSKDNISGTYLYNLYRYSGNEINFGEGNWVVDNDAGIVTFYSSMNNNLDTNDYIDIDKPIKISFYKYVGVMGLGNLDLSNDGINLTSNVNISQNLNVSGNSNLNNINLHNHTNFPDNPENIIIKYNNDLMYYDNNSWESLLIPSLYSMIKYDVHYENINYNGSEIILDINHSIIVLNINTINNSIKDSIDIRLENNLEQNGKLIHLIVSPRLKDLFNGKYFKIISNFVDPTSQGITDDGIINSIVSETAILLRHSGSSVTMIGLIYENQPYFNLISGSYDYNE
jgi:hypothetical protein